jgi:hypothetical protein
MSSFLFLFLENFSELIQILFGELLAAGEMNQEGLDRAIEEAVQKALTFGVNAVVLGNEGSIEIEVFVLRDGEGLLFVKAGEHGLDGVGMPVLSGGELLDEIISSLGRFLPEKAHDFPFGFRDGRRFHRNC